jgi:hypothetical protein
MNNICTDIFSESSFSQQYEYKQKYTIKRKDSPKGTYDKARDKANRVKSDYKTQRNAKRMDWEIV